MIKEKTIKGGYLNIELAATDFPMRSAEDNAVVPAKPATWHATLITLRFEVQDGAVAEIRAELAVDHAAYARAEAAGHFGLSAGARTAAMSAAEFSPSAPIHVVVRADMDRIGPHQFEGLDLMHNENDLEEVLVTVTQDAPRNRFHELETWSFVTVQQKADADSDPIGFDRAS